MKKVLWVRITINEQDRMFRVADIADAPLFLKLNEIFSADLETKKKLEHEAVLGLDVLIKKFPSVAYTPLDFKIAMPVANCRFGIYTANRHILIGKEFDLE